MDVNTRSYGYMADMAETLDMLPALHLLTLAGEADQYGSRAAVHSNARGAVQTSSSARISVPGQGRLVIERPIRHRLTPITRTHRRVGRAALRRGDDEGPIDLESACSNPHDMSQWFGEWQDKSVGVAGSLRWCGGCTSSSVTARLALLQFVRESCIRDYRDFDESDIWCEIRELLRNLMDRGALQRSNDSKFLVILQIQPTPIIALQICQMHANASFVYQADVLNNTQQQQHLFNCLALRTSLIFTVFDLLSCYVLNDLLYQIALVTNII